MPWQWANRSKVSDYRWSSTPIVTDRAGNVVEVRVGNWLRAPLAAAFEDVEAAYVAYRRLFELTYREDLAIRVSFGSFMCTSFITFCLFRFARAVPDTLQIFRRRDLLVD